jgi:hypothetical protein
MKIYFQIRQHAWWAPQSMKIYFQIRQHAWWAPQSMKIYFQISCIPLSQNFVFIRGLFQQAPKGGFNPCFPRGFLNIFGFRFRVGLLSDGYPTNNSVGQVARHLNHLRIHGIIKKVGERTKYDLTSLGHQWAATTLMVCASESSSSLTSFYTHRKLDFLIFVQESN